MAEARKFGDDIRLKIMLSENFEVQTQGLEEWNQIDIWRMQREQLINELVFIGINHRQTLLENSISVARSADKTALVEALMELVAINRFKPTHGMEIYEDQKAIERECDIRLGECFWYNKEPFVAYWQGEYKPDNSRREMLKFVVDEEKQKDTNWPLEDRIWQWVEAYMKGCCPKDGPVPDNQDIDDVFPVLKKDIERLDELGLEEEELAEIVRILKLDFLKGDYPIIAEEEEVVAWSDDDPILQNILEQLKQLESSRERIYEIYGLLQRYRKAKALGLNFLEEEEKIREERMKDARIRQKDRERRQQAYEIELQFLQSLDLPEWEAQDWPETLQRSAGMDSFKPDPRYQDQIQNHVRWLIKNMPEGDHWGPLTSMLQGYWCGNYHPDTLRWSVLQNECNLLPEENKLNSTFRLHEKFIEGSRKAGAKENANQNPEKLNVAYAADIQLITSLEISQSLIRKIQEKYNLYLIEGKLPIVADRELPSDRIEIEKTIRLYVGEMNILEQPVDATQIIQYLFDHWYSIANRPIQTKES